MSSEKRGYSFSVALQDSGPLSRVTVVISGSPSGVLRLSTASAPPENLFEMKSQTQLVIRHSEGGAQRPRGHGCKVKFEYHSLGLRASIVPSEKTSSQKVAVTCLPVVSDVTTAERDQR